MIRILYLDIDTSDINRPGLQFAGFDYFAHDRIQVLGRWK